MAEGLATRVPPGFGRNNPATPQDGKGQPDLVLTEMIGEYFEIWGFKKVRSDSGIGGGKVIHTQQTGVAGVVIGLVMGDCGAGWGQRRLALTAHLHPIGVMGLIEHGNESVGGGGVGKARDKYVTWGRCSVAQGVGGEFGSGLTGGAWLG
ncbi:hypothetical protein Tco_0221822 [Tanacetum coccineum]